MSKKNAVMTMTSAAKSRSKKVAATEAVATEKVSAEKKTRVKRAKFFVNCVSEKASYFIGRYTDLQTALDTYLGYLGRTTLLKGWEIFQEGQENTLTGKLQELQQVGLTTEELAEYRAAFKAYRQKQAGDAAAKASEATANVA